MPRRASTQYGILAGLLLLILTVLVLIGGFTPVMTPDSAGYMVEPGWPDMFAVERPPFYRWLVVVLTLDGRAPGLLAVAQIALYVAAAGWLMRCLHATGLPGDAVLAVGITLLLANALLLMGNWVHPEVPAIALALAALGTTVRLVHSPHLSWPLLLLLVGSGGGAYLLRPSFLPIIIAFPVCGMLWRLASWQRARTGRAAVLMLALALPFLLVASLRLAVVRDFNIVSFGGFQMSGLAALTLSAETLPRLPQDARPLAEAVLAARSAGEANGSMIGVPRNSFGIRSFHSAALGYFDVLARTHDEVLYGIVIQQRQPDESWVAFNRRLQRWSIAVLTATPERHVTWMIGATTRLIGRAMMTNLPFGLGVLALVLVVPLLWLRRIDVPRMERTQGKPDPFTALVLLGGGWMLGSGVLMVVVTFPAWRYIDSCAILLAAPVWLLVIQRIRLLLAPAPQLARTG